jgi:cell wall-associated NlpC family hydrolase
VAAFTIVASIVAPSAHARPSSAAEHVVQPGETLWQIALKTGVDAVTLLRLNNIENGDLLVTGQTLKLNTASAPSASSASSGTSAPSARGTYTVAEGDTLSGIAQQLNVSATALIESNKLDDPNRLATGAKLIVPGAASTATPAPAPAAPARAGDGVTSHTVQEGQTLSQIAAQAKIDLGQLVDANGLADPALIRVGQVIRIPASGSQRAASVSAQPLASSPSRPAATPAPTTAPAAPVAATATAAPKPAVVQAAAAPKPAATPAPTPKPAAAAPAPSAAGPSANKDGIVANAMKLLGAPYVWGGASPSGFDCSGFVWYVARQSGKTTARSSGGQYNSGSHPARNELKPGDLVFFQNTYASGISHNGIYIGNDQFVHAATEKAGVTVSSLSAQYWASHWYGATRLP